jgi:hypothetical protein
MEKVALGIAVNSTAKTGLCCRSSRSLSGVLVGSLLFLPPLLFTAPSHAITLNWSAVNEPGIGGMPVSLRVAPGDSSKMVSGGDMLGVAYSTNSGSSWGRGTGMTMWECADSTWAPGSTSTIWIGTMGGPYKSTNGGATWTKKRSGMPTENTYWGWTAPVQKVVFDPNNSSRLLAFGGSYRNWAEDNGQMGNTKNYGMVWESTNGGDSWTRKFKIGGSTGDDNNGVNVRDVEWADNGTASVLYAATRSGFYRSDNGGSTWLAKNSGLQTSDNGVVNCWSVAVHPTKPWIVWVSIKAKGGVYKSTNWGDSWTKITNGIAVDTNWDHDYTNIAVSQQLSSSNSDNPANMFVVNSGWQDLYRSTDGGANWVKVMDGSTAPDAPTKLSPQGQVLEIDPNNSNTVYVSNSVSIFKSTSGGGSGSYTTITAKPGSTSGLWQGNGYSGYVPSRARWNPHSTNVLVLLAMDDGKYMKTTDGVNWKFRGNGVNWWHGGIDVSFAKNNTVYAAFGQWNSGDGVARSTDGGDNWSYVTDPNPGNQNGGAIYVHPDQSNRVWVVRNGKLYYSSTSGSSWTQLHTSVDHFTDLAYDKNNPLTIYAAAKDGVYKTTDGSAFSKVASIQWSNSNTRICIDPNNANRFWYVSGEYNEWWDGIWRYDNGTFTRVLTAYRVSDIAVDPLDSNRVVYVTNHSPGVDISQASGVWMTENAWAGTPSWTQQNNGLPMLRAISIAFRPSGGQIIIGLQGAGFFKASTTSAGPNIISNPSFDAENYDTQTPSGWSECCGNNAASYTESYGGSKSGARHGTHWSSYSYTSYTYQTKTGLVNGLYTLRAWAKGGGGQKAAYMEAINYGGSARTVNIPVSSTYQLIEIKDINVTNGSCQIGFWSDANAGNWVYFDDVEFFKQ